MKVFKIILFVMIWAVFCMAEPADYEPFLLKQPDGTTLLARLVGDEHFSVLETADGYILQKDALGYYAYADETGKSSGIYARDPNSRSSSELQFLAKLNPDAIYQKLLAESPDDEALEYGIPKFALPKNTAHARSEQKTHSRRHPWSRNSRPIFRYQIQECGPQKTIFRNAEQGRL